MENVCTGQWGATICRVPWPSWPMTHTLGWSLNKFTSHGCPTMGSVPNNLNWEFDCWGRWLHGIGWANELVPRLGKTGHDFLRTTFKTQAMVVWDPCGDWSIDSMSDERWKYWQRNFERTCPDLICTILDRWPYSLCFCFSIWIVRLVEVWFKMLLLKSGWFPAIKVQSTEWPLKVIVSPLYHLDITMNIPWTYH